MGTHGEDFEIERLKAEIAQENQMKEMLVQSLQELQVTVDELDQRIDSINDENNEWKTRYETQSELNQQLEKQILLLQDKVEEARRMFKEGRMPKSVRNNLTEPQEISPHYLKQLEKEKDALGRQLGDMEWRLDQESKAYHKANEERKQFVLEINSTKEALSQLKVQPRNVLTPRDGGDSLGTTPRQAPHSLSNIAQDQRILDPKKGPIRKTAAVKNLPRIDQ